MIKKTRITVMLLFFGILASAQVKIGDNATNIGTSSILELESTNKGLLLPRVALTSTTSFAPLAAHVSGMTVYNTATTGDVLPGIYSSNGTTWIAIATQDASATTSGIINTTTQTLGAGAKTFTNDLTVNGVTVGKGAGTGTGNTALGLGVLAVNTTGYHNTATGFNALAVNTTGLANTALGYNSLKANTTGANNTASGNTALAVNTTGNNNTAMGTNTLAVNTIGGFNTAYGVSSLRLNTTGGSNTAIGASALPLNTTGHNNTAIGISLNWNTTGFNNSAIGTNAAYLNSTGYNNTAIGGSALFAGTTGTENTSVGYFSMKGSNIGNYNSALGSNIEFNGSISIPINNSTAIGSNTTINTSNTIQMGNSAITNANVQVAWTITSDRRWKSDIKNSDLGLDFINKLRPVSYLRKNDETKKIEYGFIAQELEETLNKIGISNAGILSKDSQGMYSVRYNDFIAPMVKAIQEQQTQIDELKAMVKQLLEKK